MGVVEEGTIPYTTEGLAKKKENQEHWLERDPKITCFLPGVANEVWAVEGGTPNTLLRRGLRRDSITPGMVIIVDGYQNKDRSARANGRDRDVRRRPQVLPGFIRDRRAARRARPGREK